MSEDKTYDKCKYFLYKECEHIDDDIMKLLALDIPKYHKGKTAMMPTFPEDEEINEICEDCNKFTPK